LAAHDAGVFLDRQPLLARATDHGQLTTDNSPAFQAVVAYLLSFIPRTMLRRAGGRRSNERLCALKPKKTFHGNPARAPGTPHFRPFAPIPAGFSTDFRLQSSALCIKANPGQSNRIKPNQTDSTGSKNRRPGYSSLLQLIPGYFLFSTPPAPA
jgi:hypothetical protein